MPSVKSSVEQHLLTTVFLVTTQWVGEARQLGCLKIVLDHTCVHLYMLYSKIYLIQAIRDPSQTKKIPLIL